MIFAYKFSGVWPRALLFGLSASIWVFLLGSCAFLDGRNSPGCPELTKRRGPEKTEKEAKGIYGIEGKDYQKGEVLVKFKSPTSRERIEEIASRLDLQIIRAVGPANLFRMKIRGKASVEDMIQTLKAYEEVEYSEPNFIRGIKDKD